MIRRPPRSTRTDTSFPTRRSSDLVEVVIGPFFAQPLRHEVRLLAERSPHEVTLIEAPQDLLAQMLWCDLAISATGLRSEEHTSELQSLMRISYAVFCLKKKN